MNLTYKEQTQLNMEAWLLQKKGQSFRKMHGSSYDGYMYELVDDTDNRIYNVDIKLTTENTVIFSVNSNLHVVNASYLPAVSLYCQQIAVQFGIVNINMPYDDISFHATSCIMENALTEQTINAYEQEALRVFRLHYDNLKALAAGKLLSLTNPSTDFKETSTVVIDSLFNKEECINKIRDYLTTSSGHNAACENRDKNNEMLYYSQILCEDVAFRMSVIVTDDGILTVRIAYGENALVIPPAYQYIVAHHINQVNSNHKYAPIFMGDEMHGLYCEMNTSLLDGSVGEKTLEFMQQIIIRILKEAISDIETLAAGLPLIKEDETSKMEILNEMLKDIPKLPTFPPKRPLWNRHHRSRWFDYLNEDDENGEDTLLVEEDLKSIFTTSDENTFEMVDDDEGDENPCGPEDFFDEEE